MHSVGIRWNFLTLNLMVYTVTIGLEKLNTVCPPCCNQSHVGCKVSSLRKDCHVSAGGSLCFVVRKFESIHKVQRQFSGE